MSIAEKTVESQDKTSKKKPSNTTQKLNIRTYSDFESECISMMASCGYPLSGNLIADGEIHRYSANPFYLPKIADLI